MKEKILCVDDDPNVLAAFKRGLRQFEVDTALSGPEALETLRVRGPYAVVICDLCMPQMDGVEFLKLVKERVPATVRIALTGSVDQSVAIEAVNQDNVFRFLTKPCRPEDLTKAVNAGVEQYRLIVAEKELLGKTLSGCIKVLNDVLSLANPVAFGHASRVHTLVTELCRELGVSRPWECEVAAMLSQIGCVTIPAETLEKRCHGGELSEDELEMFRSHPQVGKSLVTNIPRLESVAEIIAAQQYRFDGEGSPRGAPGGKKIPLGARILKVALDYDAAKSAGRGDRAAMNALRERVGWYDPIVFAALETIADTEERRELRRIGVSELVPGMELVDDVRTTDGVTVVTKGQEVTSSMCARVKNYSRRKTIVQPIRVFVRADQAMAAAT